jgi:putative AdoMet-dependent methyltransferase
VAKINMRENTWSFDKWAKRYDKIIIEDKNLFARYDEILDFVVKACKISKGKRVLDIGTGTGNLALRFYKKGALVIGLDPSAPMLAKARKKIKKNCRIEFIKVEDPFLKIPYPDNYFDAVVSSYAFHHIPHRKKPKCIKEMIRVLKKGGVWALGDICFENKTKEKQALRKYDWLDETEYFIRIDELAKVFKKFGMKLKSKQFTSVVWSLWARKI